MIILDTHIWLWWVHEVKQLTRSQVEVISTHETDIIGISTISCREVARLVEYKRLNLPCSLTEWFEQATPMPGNDAQGKHLEHVEILDLTVDLNPNKSEAERGGSSPRYEPTTKVGATLICRKCKNPFGADWSNSGDLESPAAF